MDQDDRFSNYVKKFANCYHITYEEALQHRMVQNVKECYDEETEGGLEFENFKIHSK